MLAHFRVGIGTIQMKRRRYTEARVNYETALGILHASFGDDNVRTREVLEQLVDACTAGADPDCVARYQARIAALGIRQ